MVINKPGTEDDKEPEALLDICCCEYAGIGAFLNDGGSDDAQNVGFALILGTTRNYSVVYHAQEGITRVGIDIQMNFGPHVRQDKESFSRSIFARRQLRSHV